ncbi:MAG: glycosyltransferase family 2 protein [Lachnospiraceae bacterium]
MQKVLTVVIPTYNTECFLRECLDSLLSTELAETTEILVVDDGSVDNSGSIADEYERKYPNIVKVVHKENGGHGSAINIGIALAAGTYFKVVDSDDSVEPAAYTAYLGKLKKLAKTGCDLMATPFVCVRQTKKSVQRHVKQQERKIEGADALKRDEILSFESVADRLHVRMHEWTIRTEILKEHGIHLSEHSFYVDMQYILFPVPWIKTVCILDETVYRYRLGSDAQSVSVRNMQKNREQHRNVMRSLIRFYKEREAVGDRKEILSYLARGIAKMEADEVQTVLSLPIGRAAKTELVECEQEIKTECPAAYAANEKKSLWLLRRSGYWLYPAAAVAWRLVKR